MRIIEGKKFYKADMDKAVKIDNDGWDSYNGRNKQWYSLYYEPNIGYVALVGSNSGDCYGDYDTYRFASPKSFAKYCKETNRDWTELLGEIDEANPVVMRFVDEIMA